MDQKQVKRQKLKVKNQSSMNSASMRMKKKSIKKSTQDQVLKNKIIKYFTILDKQLINKKELRWILLNLDYSSFQIQSYLNEIKNLYADDFEKRQYSSYQVYSNCLQNPSKGSWKKECIQRFAEGRKIIKLQDLEEAWDSLNNFNKFSITHQSLIELVKMYGSSQRRALNFEDLQRFLTQSNSFCS